MEDDATLDAIHELVLPRYRLADYDNPKAPHSTPDTKNLDDIRPGRGNVSGFVRVGLFKRLSSSGHAFILSPQRQRARNELFLHAIDNQLPTPLGTFSDKQIARSPGWTLPGGHRLDTPGRPSGPSSRRRDHYLVGSLIQIYGLLTPRPPGRAGGSPVDRTDVRIGPPSSCAELVTGRAVVSMKCPCCVMILLTCRVEGVLRVAEWYR